MCRVAMGVGMWTWPLATRTAIGRDLRFTVCVIGLEIASKEFRVSVH